MSLAMTRHTFAVRDPDLRDRSVLVIGLGKSGLAAARLATSRGARVTIADARAEDELGQAVDRARAIGARVYAGGHPASLAEGTDLIVVSPGVPGDVEPLLAARALDLPVWGEIELAARFCRGRVIGITGSNGKSTVTAMTGGILRGAGVPGGTGGNLDTPFCDLLEQDAENAVHAVELSSFQLETVEAFRPAVGAILNLSPDHLDRYADFASYAAAKARLLEVQNERDAAILNADDPESAVFRKAVRGCLHEFSTRNEVERGAFVRGGRMVLRTGGEDVELLESGELPLPGEHNLANALAAALACTIVGCAPDAIERGLRAYRPLAHRLELVATIDGVAFYNDSKATNPASTARALLSFAPGTVHLILGGRDKGADWDELSSLVRKRARQVLLVGEAAQNLAGQLGDRVPVSPCHSVPRAVRAGFEAARDGEVVLLSPGCASFDQYRNFGERGEDFRRVVEELREGTRDA
jgi:UDP-N-acetylmuramoylalanine--D-glutamate ligase